MKVKVKVEKKKKSKKYTKCQKRVYKSCMWEFERYFTFQIDSKKWAAIEYEVLSWAEFIQTFRIHLKAGEYIEHLRGKRRKKCYKTKKILKKDKWKNKRGNEERTGE